MSKPFEHRHETGPWIRQPQPVKISTLGNSGAGLSPDKAAQQIERLLHRSEKAANKGENLFHVLPPQPPHKPMSDERKIQFLYERGRWPSLHEQGGWY